MNKLALTGRLAKDPEFKYFDSGTALATFSIDCDGHDNQAQFFDCESWKKTAESLQSARKGDEISILGQLKQQRWTDKQSGKERSKTIVLAWNVAVFSKPKERSPQKQSPKTQTRSPNYDAMPF